MKNKILILGIDTFEAKNIPQIEEMNKKIHTNKSIKS